MNLDQSPTVLPIISPFMPCLLRGGALWMEAAPLTNKLDQGRLLTPTEKMNSIGVPMYPELCEACGLEFPVFTSRLFSDGDLAIEAGNGMNTFSVGSFTRT